MIPLCAALAACNPVQEAGNTPASAATPAATATLTVTIEAVRRERMTNSILATGTVRARQEVAVGSRASGLAIIEVLVTEGDQVTGGQVIARLDDTVLKAQIVEQEAAIESSEATLEAAEQSAERAAQLQSNKVISTQAAEERTATFRTARAQLNQARAVLDRLRILLAQTEIISPVAGVVSERPAIVGAVTQVGTELFKIIRDGKLEVAVQVPERNLLSIVAGQSAKLTDADGNVHLTTVAGVAQKVDPATRLGTVYVQLPQDTLLRSGMFVELSIETSGTEVMTVAEEALVWREGKPAVFTVDKEDRATLRYVDAAIHSGGRVAVLDGLAEGESVVVAGAGFLDNGNVVRRAVNPVGQSSTTSVSQ